MRFPFPFSRPAWISSWLAPFGDEGVDDELLHYLVSTVHSSRSPLYASMSMAAIMAFLSWVMTGQTIFLMHCLLHAIIGVGRLGCLNEFTIHSTSSDSRAKSLVFDSAFLVWSTAYALVIGSTCYGLIAASDQMQTLPLAVGGCTGFTIAFVTRSSGRLRILRNQLLGISLPVVWGLLTLRIQFGWEYSLLIVGLVASSLVMGRAAHNRIVELFHANEANRRMARLDMLTGAMNRYSFANALEDAIRAAADHADERFALITIDLDRFKEINDTLGHVAGDAVIVEMARRLKHAIRPGDVVARLGGDEFVILARLEASELGGANSLARRVIETLCQPYELDAMSLPASASVGVSLYPDHGVEALDLMKLSDIALYEAKRAGRGRFRIFDASMQSKLADARKLELEMDRAIREDQFEAWFQPIQNIETGVIVGYEALARWRHPTMGLIPPDKFIPIAEQNGSIVAIGQLILTKACAAAATWDPRLTVAVNLSPGQFRRPALLVDAIKETLRVTGLAPSRLYVEITESLLMEDTHQTRKAIHELADHGVRFSLDDFGAGYSSLSYIQSYPFSKIKIDKKFIDHVDSDNVSTAIIASVCVLADRIHMEIVAEGVETRVQQTALRGLGIRLGQGYLFGRPSPQIVAPQPALQLVSSR